MPQCEVLEQRDIRDSISVNPSFGILKLAQTPRKALAGAKCDAQAENV
jgi:hypothetical protein